MIGLQSTPDGLVLACSHTNCRPGTPECRRREEAQKFERERLQAVAEYELQEVRRRAGELASERTRAQAHAAAAAPFGPVSRVQQPGCSCEPGYWCTSPGCRHNQPHGPRCTVAEPCAECRPPASTAAGRRAAAADAVRQLQVKVTGLLPSSGSIRAAVVAAMQAEQEQIRQRALGFRTVCCGGPAEDPHRPDCPQLLGYVPGTTTQQLVQQIVRRLDAELIRLLLDDARTQLDNVRGRARLELHRPELIEQAEANWRHNNPGLSRLLQLDERDG